VQTNKERLLLKPLFIWKNFFLAQSFETASTQGSSTKKKGSPRPALFAIIHLIQYTQKTQTRKVGETNVERKSVYYTSTFLASPVSFFAVFLLFFPNPMPARIVSVTIGLNGNSCVESHYRFV
jgi:hypothetical protein